MFWDKRFGLSSVSLDKRGKPKKLDQGNLLRHYYKIEEDEDKGNFEVKKKDKKIEEEEEEEEESEEVEELGGEESEDDVASGDSDATTDIGTDDEYEEEVVFEDVAPGMEAEDMYQKLIRKLTGLLLLTWIGGMLRLLTCMRC